MADHEHSTPADGCNDEKPNSEGSGLEMFWKLIHDGFAEVIKKLEGLPSKTAEAMAELNRSAGVSVLSETKNHELEDERRQERMSHQEVDIQDQKTTIEQLKKELNDKTKEIAKLQQKAVQLRGMVIGCAGTQEVTDSEIIWVFSDLRQSVQQLASSSVFDFTTIPSSQGIEVSNQQMRHFYSVCGNHNPRNIVNRLKAEIFHIIYKKVLSRTYFGLKRDAKDPESANEFWETEKWLTHFEALLDSFGVSRNLITEWRNRTLDCIDQLNLPEKYSHFVVTTISDFLEPLVYEKATQSQREAVYGRVVEVCEKAVKLKKMMQRSKEGYAVTTFDTKGTLYSNVQSVADSICVEDGAASEASDEIAYLLFGGLDKNPQRAGAEKQSLAKAEVVLKKRR